MPAESHPRPSDGTPLFEEWLVNVGPPLLVLADLQLGYMLVSRNCLANALLSNHLVHAFFLAAVLFLLFRAWHLWRSAGAKWPGTAPDLRTRSRFMAAIGMLVGAISALVIVAQWLRHGEGGYRLALDRRKRRTAQIA